MEKVTEIRVKVSTETHRRWTEYVERKGLTSTAGVENALEWVMAQNELLAAVILKQITEPRHVRQVTRLALEEMAREPAKPKRPGKK